MRYNKSFLSIIIYLMIHLTLLNHARGFVNSRTSSGNLIRWDKSTIGLNINPNNNNGIDDTTIFNIVNLSMQQWNSIGNIKLQGALVQSGSEQGRNDIFFTDQVIFGSGVIAITNNAISSDNNTILESDIMINDRIQFSSTPGATHAGEFNGDIYLGDVITHELGHLLGLGHGQVYGSTMFFQASNGQSTISSDDKNGLFSIYPNTNANGTIQGKIVGGNQDTGIFGAHVQLISYETGTVFASVISDPDGNFSFVNVDDGAYYIYVSPFVIDATVPDYYFSAKKNFCLTGNYRGDFFSRCGSKNIGYPQAIQVTNSNLNVNVGNVSIGCHLDSPIDYMVSKRVNVSENDPFWFYIDAIKQNEFGKSFVGFFRDDEIENNQKDIVKIDLSHYNGSYTNEYLEVKVLTQNFYTEYYTQLRILLNDSIVYENLNSDDVSLDSDSNASLNHVIRIPLYSEDAPHIFTVEIIPYNLSRLNQFTSEEIIPGLEYYKDEINLYQLMVGISQYNNGSYNKVNFPSDLTVLDNSKCEDGPSSYPILPFVSLEKKEEELIPYKRASKKDDGFLSCGTISIDNNDPPNGGRKILLLSFLLGLFILPACQSILKRQDK